MNKPYIISFTCEKGKENFKNYQRQWGRNKKEILTYELTLSPPENHGDLQYSSQNDQFFPFLWSSCTIIKSCIDTHGIITRRLNDVNVQCVCLCCA